MEPLEIREGKVFILDQTRLPVDEIWLECDTVESVAHAIVTMQVRGAPLIGVSAAYGMALAAKTEVESAQVFMAHMEETAGVLGGTRPTAVNLFWGIERMLTRAREVAALAPAARAEAMMAEAHEIRTEDVAMCRAIGQHGAQLIRDGETIMTHCNAGALATAGYGSALGVIRAAVERGLNIKVLARETRPLLQGARLTAWELARAGIDVTVIPDSSGAHFMRAGEVDRVVVGADRIAANGDVANKIGTYDLALVAREHGVPFHVAAPHSTVDFSLADGSGIPIEERSTVEMTHLCGCRIVPEGIPVRNVAFDVTPAALITSIITEDGVAVPPLGESLRRLVGGKAR